MLGRVTMVSKVLYQDQDGPPRPLGIDQLPVVFGTFLVLEQHLMKLYLVAVRGYALQFY